MNSVKELSIVLVDFEVVFGPGENENNITSEMRAVWEKSFGVVEGILVDAGFAPENCTLVRDDNILDIASENDINFEDAVSLLHALEEHFAISEFTFASEMDDFYGTPPHVLYTIHSKSE